MWEIKEKEEVMEEEIEEEEVSFLKKKKDRKREREIVKECDWLATLTYSQAAAGAHGASRLRPVLGDGGDADGAAEAGAALLNTDVLV